ncbi:MAG TPA: phosphate signaling complex protein PhoU [Chitinispirillaceae bacterium]|nr:phosphate signaling complex protein PhoU [Chitinispirillaceae bacterium]
MSMHLSRAVEVLKKKVLSLATLVEESVAQAVNSVENLDTIAAEKVIKNDDNIDQMEIDVEEECLKILALHQPVAVDLRFIVSVLKLNSDLERIGDLAVKIAERTVYLVKNSDNCNRCFDFTRMYECTRLMLKKSLDSLIRMDVKLAYEVGAADDELDVLNREMYLRAREGIHSQPKCVDMYLNYIAISRSLERIGDHATNIAEDVIYMAEARIIRHSIERKKKSS